MESCRLVRGECSLSPGTIPHLLTAATHNAKNNMFSIFLEYDLISPSFSVFCGHAGGCTATSLYILLSLLRVLFAEAEPQSLYTIAMHLLRLLPVSNSFNLWAL